MILSTYSNSALPKDQRKNFNPATAHLTVLIEGDRLPVAVLSRGREVLISFALS
jgi:hypothetical protein